MDADYILASANRDAASKHLPNDSSFLYGIDQCSANTRPSRAASRLAEASM
jgi:hypothetical protein